ncbi:MAG: VWA domain-containing protein [Acidobacteria bacterium]|nr:VWA domain-containing protein [Acidobacteriota bacterium]
MRVIAVPLMLLLTSAGLAAQQRDTPAPAERATPTFRNSAAELVVLPVTVTDRSGRLVDDLPREAFAVYDEGQRQTIEAFSREDSPVSIALVIDSSGSMNSKMGEVVAATLAFARSSHPEDQLLVVEFNERVRDALDGRGITASDLPALERALQGLRPAGQTALYDALTDGLDHLERAEHARRVLVLVSDGGDNASTATLGAVLERARRSNVTLYAIGLYDEDARDTNPGVLKQLAEATGGTRFLPKSPGRMLAACQQIAREIRASYTVGYAPPARDGRYHHLRVEVTGSGHQGLRVRTRPGYVAGQ